MIFMYIFMYETIQNPKSLAGYYICRWKLGAQNELECGIRTDPYIIRSFDRSVCLCMFGSLLSMSIHSIIYLLVGGACVWCWQLSTFSGQSQTFSAGLKTKFAGHGI